LVLLRLQAARSTPLSTLIQRHHHKIIIRGGIPDNHSWWTVEPERSSVGAADYIQGKSQKIQVVSFVVVTVKYLYTTVQNKVPKSV